MSFINLTKVAAPSTPAANTNEIYVDTADNRIKQLDPNGVISILNNIGLQARNVIINGGFSIQQRIAVASTLIAGLSTTTRAGVVADRWAVTTSVASNLNWQQVDTSAAYESGLLSRFYGSIIKSSAVKKVMISQFIIHNEMSHLRGQKVRLSVKTNQKVGAGQMYKLGLLYLTAAGTTDTCPAFLTGAWSAVGGTDPAFAVTLLPIAPDASPTGENGTINGNYLEITSIAATWLRSSCIFTIPTTAKNLMVVLFSNTSGEATDNLSVAEFQLTHGPDIVDYVTKNLADELAQCQQYYCKTFALTTVPAQSVGANTGEAKGIAGIAGATALAGIIPWRFPVRMWKTPVTITLYNPAAANALMRMIARAADMGVTANTANLDSSTIVIATGVAATVVGDQIGIHITADAELVA